MPYYKITANDPSSDNGSATIIINASGIVSAQFAASKHFQEMGRSDISQFETEKIKVKNGLIYSDVETR